VEKSEAFLENKLLADRRLKLPVVSLVVVNRNGAAHLGRTIRSIREQNYPLIECVIVDNASTDESIEAIEFAVADDRRFTIMRFDENYGQLGGVLRVFARLRGSFVVVVDADDVLFPEYVASHLQVHLALAAAVGFTSSDIVEIDGDDRVLTGGRLGFAANCESEPRGLRAARAAIRLTAISDADYDRLSDATITVPHWKTQWVWAPGTANMFRKSALDLALPDVSRIRGHGGFDNYFCTILHLMTGSALICRRLSAYRFHGRNTFSSSPLMNAIRTQHSFGMQRSSFQRLAVLHTMLSRASAFNYVLAGDRFWKTVNLLSGIDGLTPRAYFAQNSVQDIIVESFCTLLEAFDARTVMSELCARLGTGATWRLMRKVYRGRVPLPLYSAFAKGVARHLWADFIRRLKTERN
jgi:glycosyltransferase involved in cell wall biosynthesis